MIGVVRLQDMVKNEGRLRYAREEDYREYEIDIKSIVRRRETMNDKT